MKTMGIWVFAFAVATGAAGACSSEEGGDNQPTCGDGVCVGETAATCPADCTSGPVCGDRTCNGTETSVTCPGDCPASGPRCGDGTCNGTENTASCPGDCPCSNNTTADDTCTGENVCVSGACVQAFGRVYRVVVSTGSMLMNNALGETWDSPGGLPDPYVTLTLNGTALGMTAAVQDTLTPTWSMSANTVIPGGSTFLFEVWDEDLADDDFMFACQFSPLTAAHLRAFQLTCPSFANQPAGVGSEIKVWFEAQ